MGGYTIPETMVLAVLGLIAVFLVLAILMYFIKLMTMGFRHMRNSTANMLEITVDKPLPAKGSCGDIKLYNVTDKEAAMIMAIVADTLQTPLNELRFISIRETGE